MGMAEGGYDDGYGGMGPRMDQQGGRFNHQRGRGFLGPPGPGGPGGRWGGRPPFPMDGMPPDYGSGVSFPSLSRPGRFSAVV